MINRVVSFAVTQPLFVLLGLLIFVGGGLIAFKNLPVEAFPDVTDTQVTIITLYPGRAAEEVERQVTIPLEVTLSGIPNSIRLFSHTQFGLSFIVVTFNDTPTGYFARQLVIERLREAMVDAGSGKAATTAMANLAEAIQGLVHHMRTEQQMIRDWVDSQSEQHREIRRLLEIMVQEKERAGR